MEQAQYWTWSTKRKHSLSPHLQASTNPSYDDSWEEQAFAEDAAGSLGGCVWPPRSYSCTFCRREFRSAQALGGHMNVHRRDRARLKQSPSPQSETHHHGLLDNQNRPLQNPYTSLGFQYPSQICTLVYSPNTSSDPGIIASPSSPSRVSATTARENCSERTFFPPFSPSIRKDHQKISYKSSSPSRPTLSTDRYRHIPDLKSEGDKNSRILESECRAKVDYLKTDLSVSLNLVVRRTRPTISDGEEDEEQEESRGCKKRKTDASSLPFFPKSKSSGDRRHLQPEIIEISPCSFEELDLELRLGDRPKAIKQKNKLSVQAHKTRFRTSQGKIWGSDC